MRLNYFVIILMAGAMLSSCKKDWVCTCQTSLLGEIVDVEEMNGWKKKEATDACKLVEKAKSFENCTIREK
jgi:hypothetical protein